MILQAAHDAEHARIERFRPIEIALDAQQLRELVAGRRDLALLAAALGELQCLLEVAARIRQVAQAQVRHADRLQRHRDGALVAKLACDGQALFEVAQRGSVAAHEDAELTGVKQTAAARGIARLGAGAHERVDRQAVAEVEQPAIGPIRSQHVRELEAERRAIACAVAPGIGCEQVLALGIEAGEPFRLLGATQFRPRRFGEADIKREVPGAYPGLVAGFLQAFLRVMAHRVEQAVALAARLERDERFLDQLRLQLEQVRWLDGVERRDRFGRFQRPAAGEHREAAQHRALVLGQQVVTPVDERAQRLLAGQRALVAARQQAEAVVKPRGDGLYRHRAHACRGELDGERDAV